MLRKDKTAAKKRSRKLILIGTVTAVLLIAAGTWFWATRTSDTRDMNVEARNDSNHERDDDQQKPTKTSEGQTFPVPNDLPPDAVKNYVLITENEEYKIRQLEGTNKYTVTLYAIINNPSQYDMYTDQLKEYKQKSLDYLKNKNVDLSKIEVTYEPEEAANL